MQRKSGKKLATRQETSSSDCIYFFSPILEWMPSLDLLAAWEVKKSFCARIYFSSLGETHTVPCAPFEKTHRREAQLDAIMKLVRTREKLSKDKITLMVWIVLRV